MLTIDKLITQLQHAKDTLGPDAPIILHTYSLTHEKEMPYDLGQAVVVDKTKKVVHVWTAGIAKDV